MFGPTKPSLDLRKSWSSSSDDDSSSCETRAESSKPEPFSIFGFNLFESEATLQVNDSKDSESVSTDDDVTTVSEMPRRRFFERIWEKPTENTDGNDDESEEEEGNDKYVPESKAGFALRRVAYGRQSCDDASQRSNTSALYQHLFAESSAADAVPSFARSAADVSGLHSVGSKSTKWKRGFWKLKKKRQQDVEEVERSQDLKKTGGDVAPWKQRWNPPTGGLLENDQRDDYEEVQPTRNVLARTRDKASYADTVEGREQFKCFPHRPPRGDEISTAHHAGRFSSPKFPLCKGKLEEEDEFNEKPINRCFPSWSSPTGVLEPEPSDLSSSKIGSTDGYERSVSGRRTHACGTSRASEHARSSPCVEAPSSIRHTSKRISYVPTNSNPKQLDSLLAQYQPDFTVPKLGATLPMSKTKCRRRASANNPRRRDDSWDDQTFTSGWFTLESLDA